MKKVSNVKAQSCFVHIQTRGNAYVSSGTSIYVRAHQHAHKQIFSEFCQQQITLLNCNLFPSHVLSPDLFHKCSRQSAILSAPPSIPLPVILCSCAGRWIVITGRTPDEGRDKNGRREKEVRFVICVRLIMTAADLSVPPDGCI